MTSQTSPISDWLYNTAAALALVAAAFLFVESLQKPGHQDNWIYKLTSTIWRWLESITDPSIIATLSRLLVTGLWLLPNFVSQKIILTYFYASAWVYRAFGGYGRGILIRDTLIPWCVSVLSIFATALALFKFSWQQAALCGMIIASVAFFTFFICFVFLIALILIPIVVVFAISLLSSKLLKKDRPVRDRAKVDSADEDDSKPPAIVSLVTLAFHIPVLISCFFLPYIASWYTSCFTNNRILTSAVSFLSATIMFPITAHIIAKLKREIRGTNSRIDYHLAVPYEAEDIVQPIFFLFLTQSVATTIISFSYLMVPNELIVNLTILILNSVLGLVSIYAITSAAKRAAGLEFDDWLDDPQDTLTDYVSGYLNKGKGIKRGASRVVVSALGLIILIAIAISYLDSQADGDDLTVMQAAYATFGRRITTGCRINSVCPTIWHFGATFFLADIICIPVILTIMISLTLSAFRPFSRYFRRLTRGAWTLVQPYPLIARFFGFLAAALTILRLYGHDHWSW